MIALGILLVAAFVLGPYIYASVRVGRLRRELEALRAQRTDSQPLIARIWQLEKTVEALQRERGGVVYAEPPPMEPAAAVVVDEPVAAAPVIEETPERVMAAAAFAEVALPEPVQGVGPEPQFVFESAPGPSLRTRLSSSMAGKDWESTLGGNWLNKLGVLVLIIGIGLFLGYSFTQMGPAGRVSVALAVSAAMLAAGVYLEQKALYGVFGRGLIGGGWAGVYFTTYAMYAVDAAKVIDNPWLASILLLAVATGMIGHSLKYRSQAVSGLAYFVAFATLALTPVTAFSVIALLPLAASLLYLAHRFEWFKMALFGVLATYATCASRGDSGTSVAAAQSMVGAYWLLFEIFVILRASRKQPFDWAEQLIFPLNTLGLFALSLPKWHHTLPHNVWIFLAACAAVHVIGAILRGQRPEPRLITRILNAGYEGPITLAACFAAVAIWLRLTTVWINFGLLVEGEILFMAGLWLRLLYLQRLGAAVFGVATAKLVYDAPDGGRIGRLYEWTPVAILSSALMYVNRYLGSGARYFSYGAAVPLLLVAGFESPAPFVAVAWFALAVALFEFGAFAKLSEFRFQSYGFVGFAMAALLPNNLDRREQWIAVGLCVLLAYWLTLRTRQLTGREGRIVPLTLSLCTTAAAVLFVAGAAPSRYLGAAWLALAAVLLELGLRGLPRYFRYHSYPVAVLGWANVAVFGLFEINKNMPLDWRLSIGAAALVSYAILARAFPIDRFYRIAAAWTGTTIICFLLWSVLADPVVAVGWCIVGLILMEVATLHPLLGGLTVQADLLSVAVFGRLFMANFVNMGSTSGISHRLLTTVPVIAAEYYTWHRRQGTRIAHYYCYAAAILVVLLMRFELGRVLTVTGWAAFVLALFWLGRSRREIDFRLQSYAIALLCFWRSWTTNFYVPDSFAGVPGRIATAAFVVIAFYAAQLLAPREPNPKDSWPDRYARPLFSLLASTLVSILIYYEIGGGMLSVAWGIQATCLLAAGFWIRDRILRLSGLVLFLGCILKLFLYDLRNLETMNRILSFIVLGGVMVGVSWVYSRFRNQIQRYL